MSPVQIWMLFIKVQYLQRSRQSVTGSGVLCVCTHSPRETRGVGIDKQHRTSDGTIQDTLVFADCQPLSILCKYSKPP